MNAMLHHAGRHRRRRGNRPLGAATVEFALVAPLVFLVVFGIIAVGRGLMVTHALSSAASQACRRAVVGSLSTSAVTTNVSNNLAAWGIRDQTTTVQVNGATNDPAAAASGDQITVTVSLPMSSVLIVPGFSSSGQVTRTYTLRKE
jgi:Flp pilus assembly protein TadG